MNFSQTVSARIADMILVNPFRLRSDVGIVSFSFDDFARSALVEGGAILGSQGVAGTYYASGGLTGREENGRPCHSESDLLAALNDGHEIGSHGMRHVAAPTLSRDGFETDLQENADFMKRVLGIAALQSYSYPFGKRTFRDKRIVARRFRTGRGVRRGVNGGLCDLADLRANPIYASQFDEAGCQRLIDMAARSRGWVIFYTHDISENPTPWGCLPRMLKTVVRFAAESGCKVLTVGDACETLCIQDNGKDAAGTGGTMNTRKL